MLFCKPLDSMILTKRFVSHQRFWTPNAKRSFFVVLFLVISIVFLCITPRLSTKLFKLPTKIQNHNIVNYNIINKNEPINNINVRSLQTDLENNHNIQKKVSEITLNQVTYYGVS